RLPRAAGVLPGVDPRQGVPGRGRRAQPDQSARVSSAHPGICRILAPGIGIADARAMSREAELYKDKIEVSLDGRQIFYLFFGGAVIVGLVFVLGVMVGRRVEARGH